MAKNFNRFGIVLSYVRTSHRYTKITRKGRIEDRKEDIQTTVWWNTVQYSKTNQSRHPPNAPGCKMQIEQNRRSAAFARGLMRTVSSPVIEAVTSARKQPIAGNRRGVQ